MSDESDFEELVELAGRELTRRFKENPDDLPGTFVIKLFLDGNKAIRAGDVPDDDAAEPDPDVLDLIQDPGLPPDRKKELLLSERTKIVERLAALDTALEEL